MPSFGHEISSQYSPLFEAAKEYDPVDYINLVDGVEITEDVLSVPIAGRAVGYSPLLFDPDRVTDTDSFVLRTVIGYAAACRLDDDHAKGILFVSSLINGCVLAAYKKLGNRILSLRFDTPEEPGVYFKEMQHAAGYEIRLTGKVIPEFEQEDSNGTLP